MKLKECPFCGGLAGLERDSNIFQGQCYSDRYQPSVANQDHGYRIRCGKCGCQTCWWHFKAEASKAWDSRHLTPTAPDSEGRCEKCDGNFKHSAGCPNIIGD